VKNVPQRASLLVGLFAFGIVWTGLMGMGVRIVSPSASGSADSANPISGQGAHITYVDNSRFPELTAYVAVNDSSGQPVLELPKERFVLEEDGVSVDVTNFVTAGGQAATVFLVIDRSGSMDNEMKMVGAKKAALSFIDHLQSGQDRVGVIAFSNSVDTLSGLELVTEADRASVKRQIDRLSANGGTEFYRAVQTAIGQLRAVSGRKVILALTDGLDDDGQRRLSSTIQMAIDAKVPVYTIGLGSNLDTNGLSQLAQQSGAAFFHSPSASQLDALYQSIATGLRNEYALTYSTLTQNLDGTLRNLAVEVVTNEGTTSGEGGYQVGGILASSFNLALFLPLLIVLSTGLVGLYTLPGWRRRQNQAVADDPKPNQPERDMSKQNQLSQPIIFPDSSVQPSVVSPHQMASTATLLVRFQLNYSRMTVGSGPTCGVVIAHPSVADPHINIFTEGGHFILEDLGSGRSWVSYNGDPAQLRPVQRNALRDGSLIQLGDIRLTFHSAENHFWLEQSVLIPSTGISIGSAPNSGLCLPGLRSQHATIAADGQRWIVENVGGSEVFVSYSGDQAQERAVSGRNALKSGSMIRMGSVQLVLQQ